MDISGETMRILLTGGAGFIGSHIAEYLLEQGHEVAVVDNLSTGRLDNVPEGARFYEADIRSGCAEVFEEFEPEIFSHQAAQIDVRRSVCEPDFDAEVNVLGVLRLLENCVKHDVQKVIFASSGGAVYGEQQEFPASEDHPQCPLSPYGVSKLASELYLNFYYLQYGLPYIALRYANVYGPLQDPHGEAGVVAVFCEKLAKKEVCRINGTGEQTRDYVYVGDVARANGVAVESEAPSGSYNVGTGIETSVNQLHELMREISGSSLLPEYGPAKPGEQQRSSIDFSKAEKLLNWKPEVALGAGLKETIRFFGY